MKEKLTLEHLAPYLPYGLICIHKFSKMKNVPNPLLIGSAAAPARSPILEKEEERLPPIYGVVYYKKVQNRKGKYTIEEVLEYGKPILRPLSDLMVGVDFTDLEIYELQTKGIWSKFSIAQWEAVWRNHYDIFGLIEKGLAIDINTLNN